MLLRSFGHDQEFRDRFRSICFWSRRCCTELLPVKLVQDALEVPVLGDRPVMQLRYDAQSILSNRLDGCVYPFKLLTVASLVHFVLSFESAQPPPSRKLVIVLSSQGSGGCSLLLCSGHFVPEILALSQCSNDRRRWGLQGRTSFTGLVGSWRTTLRFIIVGFWRELFTADFSGRRCIKLDCTLHVMAKRNWAPSELVVFALHNMIPNLVSERQPPVIVRAKQQWAWTTCLSWPQDFPTTGRFVNSAFLSNFRANNTGSFGEVKQETSHETPHVDKPRYERGPQLHVTIGADFWEYESMLLRNGCQYIPVNQTLLTVHVF